ncbi:tripartite motif-containing protein 2-like [Saccoglossus kowalevskii]|uniref:Tripartite motif-containing protein 3-like n=1 Tax=Saccoglossus kowalevskii TaxID=10224 RepID=A0ABM0LZQ0_SACKO|nr:PREDICTED: tripartite motif-containing protein 3-like [Saccoglossus kowalevskii]
MASAESKLLHEIHEYFLVCAVCSERYRNARILPCFHSFCEQCVCKLVDTAGGNSIICPVCRKGHDLRDGLAGIPKNFYLNELVGLFDKKRSEDVSTEAECGSCEKGAAQTRCLDCAVGLCDGCTRIHHRLHILKSHRLMSLETYIITRFSQPPEVLQPFYCNNHHDNQIKFHCDTCDIPICSECTDLNHVPSDHDYRYLNYTSSKHKMCLEDMVDRQQEIELQANDSKQELKRMSEILDSHLHEEVTNLNQHIEKRIIEIKAKFNKDGDKLLADMKREYQSLKQNLKARIKELEVAEIDMKNASDFGEKLINSGNAEQMMSAKRRMASHIDGMIESNTEQNQAEDGFVQFKTEYFHKTQSLGLMRCHRCSSEPPDVSKFQIARNEEKTVAVTTNDEYCRSSAITETRSKLKTSDKIERKVKSVENQDRTMSLKNHFKVDETHKLSVSVLNPPIERSQSPAVISIIGNKSLICKYGVQGIGVGQFNNILGVSVGGNGVTAVCDPGNHRVQLFSVYGTHQRVLHFTHFTSDFNPRYVAVSRNGFYFVTDWNNRQVVVCDENNKIIRCFGNQELTSPMGIAISPVNDRVYISDYNTHCVKIYTQDGEYIKTFGSHGSGKWQFSCPWGMTVNNKGNVIVADYSNHRIQVCDPNGVFLFSFGSKGNGNNQFNCPYDVACDNNGNMYVSDYCNNRVMKYDSHGVFISRIDSDQDALRYPGGIGVTGDNICGRIVVSNRGDNCVKVFAQ